MAGSKKLKSYADGDEVEWLEAKAASHHSIGSSAQYYYYDPVFIGGTEG